MTPKWLLNLFRLSDGLPPVTPSDNIDIRRIRPNDIPAIVVLDHTDGFADGTRDDLHAVAADLSAHVFVALRYGQLAGYYVATNEDPAILVERFRVFSEHQGCGVEARLMEHLKTRLRVERPHLLVTVPSEDGETNETYRRFGFKARALCKDRTCFVLQFTREWPAVYPTPDVPFTGI